MAASESIRVLNRSYGLPGLGSYVAEAVAARDMRALAWAVVTMVGLTVAIDQFFWRPLLTVADMYKLESSAGEVALFWVVDLWRVARLPGYIVGLFDPVVRAIDRRMSRRTRPNSAVQPRSANRADDRWFNVVLALIIALLIAPVVRFILQSLNGPEVLHAALLGLATAGRVLLLIVLSTIVWTPIGVVIGFDPRLAGIFQPVIQVFASFPANFVFPFATLLFLTLGLSLNWGSILLMALGSQWYLLFNIIGGAQSIPNDLREMATSIGLRRFKVWRALIGPGVFASW